jgi:quercetin dioxygenase-like cupin family protein
MNTKLYLTLAFVAVTGGVACSSISDGAAEKRMVVVPFEGARFLPVSPRLPDGPRMAVLWGDPNTGPSAVLLEMKKGSVPLHIHTADYHLVVIEGVMRHWAQGQAESAAPSLGPGSYWFQPGSQPHGDACLTDKCVMHVVWAGARDATLASSTER